MKGRTPNLVASFVAVILAGAMAVAQSDRPLPDEEPLFSVTRQNLSRAQREQAKYAYRERRTDIHVNPFGSRVGTGGTRVYDYTPLGGGAFQRHLIESDGKPVTDAEVERLERRPRQQAPSRTGIDDVVDVLTFHIDRREALDGRDAIVVTFVPKPNARPQTREGRLARSFKGTIWIDEQAREVVRVQAVAIDDLSFGYGFLARLNEGSTATMTRQPVEGGIWLPTSLRFAGEGRAMLLRKLTLDYAIQWFDYRKVL